MPRGRFISREISTDDKVAYLPDEAERLLYTWIILHLDKEGRIPADPFIIKGIVVPRTTHTLKKVSKTIESLVNLKLCVRYSVNGFDYLEFPNFLNHQTKSALDRESPSVIPENPARATQELRKSNDRQTLGEVKVKVKVKDKVKEEEREKATSPEITKSKFDEYVEELRPQYTDLDYDKELKKFHLYWSEGSRKLKRPKSALTNWMDKAREFKQEKVNGKRQRNFGPEKVYTELPLPKSITDTNDEEFERLIRTD